MICKWGTKKPKFKTENEKIIMGELLLISLFLKMKNEEINMMTFSFFFLLVSANINREVEDFDHVQVNRYEQTDDIILG
jgi:hypothetical protein